jgi:hypothetical protein
MLASFRISRCPPPKSCLVASRYAQAHLLDSYTTELHSPKAVELSIREIAQCAFLQPPTWQNLLVAVRDIIVKPFGIKMTSALRKKDQTDRYIGYFPILQMGKNEIVLGVTDTHLDFELSVLREDVSGRTMIYITSVVHCHNLLGRVYLICITPFHRIIARLSLARLKKRMDD